MLHRIAYIMSYPLMDANFNSEKRIALKQNARTLCYTLDKVRRDNANARFASRALKREHLWDGMIWYVKRSIKCTCVNLRNKINIMNTRDESAELPQHVIAQVNVYRCFDKLEVLAQFNGGCECVWSVVSSNFDYIYIIIIFFLV